LVGEKCYLSPCSPEDAEKWAEWFNDLEVTLPLGDEAYSPSTLEGESETISAMTKDRSHVFSIVDLQTDTLIGRCLLFGVNLVDRTAMLGIVIGEKSCWSSGYGQEAIRLLLDYGFNLLNLNSVMLGVFAFNERAITCYKKVGFKEIGRRRQARIIGGKKYDAVLMDILAEEFESAYVSKFIKQA
jgi:RimJ/RimL family protein N-acetyltransferase